MIAKKGVGILGGNKLWLVAADGTQYYYAHFDIHRGGGAAIDPFPILDAVRRSDIGALNISLPAPLTTTTLVGEVRAGVGVASDFAVADVPK